MSIAADLLDAVIASTVAEMRRCGALAIAIIGVIVVQLLTVSGPTLAQGDDGGVVVDSTTTGSTLPLVEVPFGCAPWAVADVVFTGVVTATDARTARFGDLSIRWGELPGLDPSGTVDIRYGIDVQYLTEGERYLVGASLHPDLGIPVSRITPEVIDFAGDEIVGVSEDDVVCPVEQDPVVTLLVDGSPVPTPLVGSFIAERTRLAAAVVIPAIAVAGVIFLLAMLRVSTEGFVESLRIAGSRRIRRSRSSGGDRARP